MNALILFLSLCLTERFTFSPEIEHVIHADVQEKIYVDAKTDGEIFQAPVVNGLIPTISQEKDDQGNVIRRDFYYDQKILYTGQKLLDFNPKIKEVIKPATVGDPNFTPAVVETNSSTPPTFVEEEKPIPVPATEPPQADETELFKDVPPNTVLPPETKNVVYPQTKTIKPVAAKTFVAKTNVNACGCQPTHYHQPKKPWKKRYRR